MVIFCGRLLIMIWSGRCGRAMMPCLFGNLWKVSSPASRVASSGEGPCKRQIRFRVDIKKIVAVSTKAKDKTTTKARVQLTCILLAFQSQTACGQWSEKIIHNIWNIHLLQKNMLYKVEKTST